MTLLLMLIAAAAAEPMPFEIVEMREPKRGTPILVARAGNGERYVGVGCAPYLSRNLVPLARMAGVKDFWAVPGALAGGHRVRYSFDGGTEAGSRWFGRGEFVGAVQQVSKPGEFIRGLTGATSVKLRIYEVGSRHVEDSFSYSGASEAVAELARRCNLPADGTVKKKAG